MQAPPEEFEHVDATDAGGSAQTRITLLVLGEEAEGASEGSHQRQEFDALENLRLSALQTSLHLLQPRSSGGSAGPIGVVVETALLNGVSPCPSAMVTAPLHSP